MTKRLLLTACLCLLFSATGCQLIYKQNIQQGNALEQEDLDQLEIGMSKNQVAFLLGTPAIQDPFHQDRWDYVSSFARRGGDPVRRLVTLRFENGSLTEMSGVQPSTGEEVLTADGPEGVTPSAPTVGVDIESVQDDAGIPILREGSESWTLQFGSFSDRQSADALADSLASDGIEARVYEQIFAGTSFFVVRGEDYASREAALQAMNDIESRTDRRPFVVTPGS